MDHQNRHKYEQPWDDGVYGTGPTEPPKNRGGLIALLLILIIFLCGIVTVLGILNVRLFNQLSRQEEDYLSIAVVDETLEEAEPEPAMEEVIPEAEALPDPASAMDLQDTPLSVDNVPPGGSMPLQEIYLKNIQSVVSITTVSQRGTGSTGTGVIVSGKGYIVTNAHVVEKAAAVTVQLMDDRSFSASLVGADEISDLAVLWSQIDV